MGVPAAGSGSLTEPLLRPQEREPDRSEESDSREKPSRSCWGRFGSWCAGGVRRSVLWVRDHSRVVSGGTCLASTAAIGAAFFTGGASIPAYAVLGAVAGASGSHALQGKKVEVNKPDQESSQDVEMAVVDGDSPLIVEEPLDEPSEQISRRDVITGVAKKSIMGFVNLVNKWGIILAIFAPTVVPSLAPLAAAAVGAYAGREVKTNITENYEKTFHPVADKKIPSLSSNEKSFLGYLKSHWKVGVVFSMGVALYLTGALRSGNKEDPLSFDSAFQTMGKYLFGTVGGSIAEQLLKKLKDLCPESTGVEALRNVVRSPFLQAFSAVFLPGRWGLYGQAAVTGAAVTHANEDAQIYEIDKEGNRIEKYKIEKEKTPLEKKVKSLYRKVKLTATGGGMAVFGTLLTRAILTANGPAGIVIGNANIYETFLAQMLFSFLKSASRKRVKEFYRRTSHIAPAGVIAIKDEIMDRVDRIHLTQPLTSDEIAQMLPYDMSSSVFGGATVAMLKGPSPHLIFEAFFRGFRPY